MSVEHEIRADEVKPGDYLAGLGRVQSFNDSGGPMGRRRITLFSEGNDWKVSLHPLHRVVVARPASEHGTPNGPTRQKHDRGAS